MKQRLISALVALIICIPLVLIGGIPFKIGVSILSIIGLFELIRCSNKNIKYAERMKVVSYILIFLFVMISENTIIKILSTFLILSTPMIFIDNEKYNFESFNYLFSSIVFLGLAFSYFVTIRNNDLNVFIFLFLITILTDTFAFIAGKTIGKHKLIPSVSPGKTIEGSIVGSLIGTIIPSIFYLYMVDPGASFPFIIIIVFILSILGQLGDLFFSSIKRYYGVKDFSNIMPGHGGILDRLDSIVFVLLGYIVLINFI